MMIFSPEIGVAIACEKVKLHNFSSTVLRKTNPVNFDQVKKEAYFERTCRTGSKALLILSSKQAGFAIIFRLLNQASFHKLLPIDG